MSPDEKLPVGVFVSGQDEDGRAQALLSGDLVLKEKLAADRPLHELTAPEDLRAWAYHHVARVIADHYADEDQVAAYLGLGILMGFTR